MHSLSNIRVIQYKNRRKILFIPGPRLPWLKVT